MFLLSVQKKGVSTEVRAPRPPKVQHPLQIGLGCRMPHLGGFLVVCPGLGFGIGLWLRDEAYRGLRDKHLRQKSQSKIRERGVRGQAFD